MATTRHPKGSDSVTPRTEGGAHVRGTDAKNYDTTGKRRREAAAPRQPDREAERAAGGLDARDAMGGRSDLGANPGIGSSGGTTDSGERGIAERDRGAGIDRNDV